MKKKYFSLFILLAAVLSLSSCSLLDKVLGKTEGVDDKKVKKAAVLPQDREAIQKQASLKTFTPAEFAKGVIKGDWAIEEVYGKKAVGETAPFLKFDQKQKMVYGNNGCNTINANYKYNPEDSTLSFSNIVSTMMLCAKSDITDYEINQALNDTHGYSSSLDDNQNTYWLTLYNEDGNPIMKLMHQNFSFLNGTWKVVSIEDEPVDVSNMKIVIDVDEQRVHGNSGCNVLNGVFTTDMDSPNSISFHSLATTRMSCPDLNYEIRLLVALEDASRAKPIEAGKVLFLDDQSKVVLTLIRTTDK